MTPDDVASLFVRDYAVMSFVASLGAIQIGASFGGLRGLLFLRRERFSKLLGAALIVAGVAYFFLSPLWIPGPWGATPAAGSQIVGAEGKTVSWGRAGWSNLAGARNVNDVHGGLSGTAQGLYFPMFSALALLATLAATSVLNRRMNGPAAPPDEGLQALQTGAYPRALRRSLAYWRREWRDEVASRFSPERGEGGVRALALWWRRK